MKGQVRHTPIMNYDIMDVAAASTDEINRWARAASNSNLMVSQYPVTVGIPGVASTVLPIANARQMLAVRLDAGGGGSTCVPGQYIVGDIGATCLDATVATPGVCQWDSVTSALTFLTAVAVVDTCTYMYLPLFPAVQIAEAISYEV